MKSKQDEVKCEVYLTTDLLKSKALAMYQQDFVKVILTKPEYTLEEAKAEIEKALRKEIK